jgi:hypothetical protein
MLDLNKINHTKKSKGQIVNMNKLNRSIIWSGITAIALLIVLSVIGAFRGAGWTKLLFNSPALVFFWYFLLILFLVGLAGFKSLHQRPGLFIIHIGCLLVLAGSMWGSGTAHQLRGLLTGAQKVPVGYMLLFKGSTDNNLMSEDFSRQLGRLPFSIRLIDFRVEYYDSQGGDVKGQQPTIRDYFSDIVIIDDGKESAVKTIEVNHPLHYRGYHFYQYSYDWQSHQFSVLQAVSDSGLYVVYAGYWLLCIGVIWQLWLRHIAKYIRRKKEQTGQ